MAKRLEISETIKAQLQKSLQDEDIDFNAIAVFENTATTTYPLTKRGSIFDKGRITRGTLVEMAQHLEENNVPLQTLHNNDELPTGRVFHGEVFDLPDGNAELRVLFYTEADSEIARQIDANIITETSIGLLSKSLLCSECGWDYLGEDGGFMAILDRTCANDHTLGENGIHLNLAGVDHWGELSLVPAGAAKNAKIHSKSKSKLGAAQIERLAATGISPEAVFINATTSIDGDNETMVDKEFLTQLQSLTADNTRLDIELKAAADAKTALEAKLAEATTRIEELEAAASEDASAEKIAELEASVAANTVMIDALHSALEPHVKAAGAVLAKDVPEDLAGQIMLISEAKAFLSHIPVETGATGGSEEDVTQVAVLPATAFKTRK